MKKTIRKALEIWKVPGISIPLEEKRTKESFSKDCDINNIIKKFVASGYPPIIRDDGIYADHTATDLFEAMQIVAEANTMFQELPSNIRNKFENDPVKFLDFTQNPDNVPEMIELGLAKAKKPAPAEPTPPAELTPPAEPTPPA